MRQTASADMSTLATLFPSRDTEIAWARQRNSSRYQGSYLFNLRRPSRTPVFSRNYVPGDPTNMIDWRAYARTDQLIIRESRDEASTRVRICVDGSSSMRWPDAAVCEATGQQEPTKLEVAYRAAMNLAHAHLAMGDFVELWLLEDDAKMPQWRIQPRSPSDVVADFTRVERAGFIFAEIKKSVLRSDAPLGRATLAYWFGDALGSGDIESFLDTGARGAFFHILSERELKVDWLDSSHCYFDESIVRKEYQGADLLLSDGYSQEIREWIESWRQKIQERMKLYAMFTDQSRISAFQQTWLRVP